MEEIYVLVGTYPNPLLQLMTVEAPVEAEEIALHASLPRKELGTPLLSVLYTIYNYIPKLLCSKITPFISGKKFYQFLPVSKVVLPM